MSEGEITLGKLFDFMVARFDKIDTRLDEGEDRFDKLERVGSATLEQAQRTNGRMDRAEDWQLRHDGAHIKDERLIARAEGYEAGQQAERDRTKGMVAKVWDTIRTPVLSGLFLGVSAGTTWIFVNVWNALGERPW